LLTIHRKETSMTDQTTPQPDTNPENRSDNLLPTDGDDSGDDGRFEVAEEVSLDQQSDSSRRVGQVAEEDAASKALAESIAEKSQPGI
jgi:hypothetical protein